MPSSRHEVKCLANCPGPGELDELLHFCRLQSRLQAATWLETLYACPEPVPAERLRYKVKSVCEMQCTGSGHLGLSCLFYDLVLWDKHLYYISAGNYLLYKDFTIITVCTTICSNTTACLHFFTNMPE